MNKMRVEALSDGVFAIVMTLLIMEFKVPNLSTGVVTNAEMIDKMRALWPILRSYFVSFIILGMYWVAHHAYFHMFTKHVDRVIAYLNILFLMSIAFIPFSAHLIGQYPQNEVAVASYGLNIICVGMTLYIMLWFIIHNRHMMHDDVSPKLIAQATIRVLLPPAFAVLGIIAGFAHVLSLSFFLFAFPIIFNIIPGSLDALERVPGALLRRENGRIHSRTRVNRLRLLRLSLKDKERPHD